MMHGNVNIEKKVGYVHETVTWGTLT